MDPHFEYPIELKKKKEFGYPIELKKKEILFIINRKH